MSFTNIHTTNLSSGAPVWHCNLIVSLEAWGGKVDNQKIQYVSGKTLQRVNFLFSSLLLSNLVLVKGASWRNSRQVGSSVGAVSLWPTHVCFSAGTPGLERGSGRKGTFQLDGPLRLCHMTLPWVHCISVGHALFEGEALSYYTFFWSTEILIVTEVYRYFWKIIIDLV